MADRVKPTSKRVPKPLNPRSRRDKSADSIADPGSAARHPELDDESALYLYGITETGFASALAGVEGVDGRTNIESFRHNELTFWVSRVSRREYADELQQRLESLDWLAERSIRHQRVLAELSRDRDVLPTRLGIVFLSFRSLRDYAESAGPGIRKVLERIKGCEEWGVKVFASPKRREADVTPASSGADYLKRKANSLSRAQKHAPDPAIEEFGQALAMVSKASTTLGKSGGQPNLVWSASFLVVREEREPFEQTLRRFAAEWGDDRRIEITGPWPPYSFVGDHGQQS